MGLAVPADGVKGAVNADIRGLDVFQRRQPAATVAPHAGFEVQPKSPAPNPEHQAAAIIKRQPDSPKRSWRVEGDFHRFTFPCPASASPEMLPRSTRLLPFDFGTNPQIGQPRRGDLHGIAHSRHALNVDSGTRNKQFIKFGRVASIEVK